jgi:hypothetical protein
LAFLLKTAAEFTKIIRYCERETKYNFSSDLKDRVANYINETEKMVTERDRRTKVLTAEDRSLTQGYFRGIRDYLNLNTY